MKLHVRLNGTSRTLPAEDLGIRSSTGDEEIRRILARFYELNQGALKGIVVDRNPDGIVVRPPAVFG